ncbi:MAG: VCBS repeat-containing protein [Chloroflexi bacterium]|nr:MAG: VCBS repeat-containing protein [Chloroflexota bacterium]
MKKQFTIFPIFLILILSVFTLTSSSNAAPDSVATPILKWQHGGCYNSWCETGWYSSAAVADLDGDNKPEVIGGTYSLFVLNGENGTVDWSVDPPGGRIWAGVVIADIDNNGDLEIVTTHGSGTVNVHDHNGNQVWSKQPSGNELRGLVVYDIDNDSTMEIIVSAAIGSKTNTWVLEHNGATRSGWPRLNNDDGYAWGVYNDNATVGDMDGDGVAEIVVPSDVHYINAYEANGSQIPAYSMYGNKGWGKTGVHVDHAVDIRGYANCGSEHRPNFAHSAASMVDVNNDGELEVIVVGNVYNCGTNPYTNLYEMPFIFNADRSRWSGSGKNWEAIPTPDGSAAPLIENYNVIESVHPNPVIADLDGDGLKEVLYPSYDGRLHTYWLDKTEHHNWPFNVNATGPGYRFASEPIIADLDNDSKAEVIFTSWPQKGSNYVGKLHILSYQGSVLQEINLPAAFGSPDWNGGLAAPTIANIDADSDMELVINTSHSGFVAYDLPGTANARILWGTGRNNYQRTGSLLQGNLFNSNIQISPLNPGPNETAQVTITLRNFGPDLDSASLTSQIPANVTYAGNLTASSGTSDYAGGTVNWSGVVETAVPVTIQFNITINGSVTDPTVIQYNTTLDDGLGNMTQLPNTIIANGTLTFLPIMIQN